MNRWSMHGLVLFLCAACFAGSHFADMRADWCLKEGAGAPHAPPPTTVGAESELREFDPARDRNDTQTVRDDWTGEVRIESTDPARQQMSRLGEMLRSVGIGAWWAGWVLAAFLALMLVYRVVCWRVVPNARESKGS